ncbi:MAG: DUF3857 and transglutaminase domain-containing protein [Saprospiraceae bacterium]|nr:DUF3857 and transglutaminase domain-containing protein [Saprospiraceae bacterium]
MRGIIFTTILVIAALSAVAQVDYTKTKFGKDIEADLKKSSYEIDTSASSIILFDKKDVSYALAGEQLSMFETRHRRVKILKKSDLDRADIAISFYSKDKIQDINQVKAVSYNLEGGKVSETKLSKKDIFEVKEDDATSKLSFSVPNVKVGTVFEYEYTIRTQNRFTVPTFYFENHVPTLHSELKFEQPEWFDYSILNLVKRQFSENKVESTTGSLGPGYAKFSANINTWIMKNIPALKEEAYVTTLNDYRDQIRFKLVATKPPVFKYKSYNQTWQQIVADLESDTDFGGQLKGNKNVLEELPAAIGSLSTEKEKAQAVYIWLKERVKWDQYYGLYSFSSFKSILNKQSGDAADMNLMLCKLLRHYGIEADPLLISTRSHGAIEELYPSTSAFNYPIVFAQVDGKPILMNAASDNGYNLPRINDLGEKGLLVNSQKLGWVDIKEILPRTNDFLSIRAAISETGDITGSVQMQENGYAGARTREALNDNSLKAIISSNKAEEVTEFTLENETVENENDIHKTLKCSGEFEILDYGDAVGDFIYFNPIVFGRFEENIFKSETRSYPVDFPYPFTRTLQYFYDIPEGYEVQEIPEPVRVRLPNNGGEMLYLTQFVDNQLQITNKVSVKNTYYDAQQYPVIKEFFDLIVENQQGQIVLQKTSN